MCREREKQTYRQRQLECKKEGPRIRERQAERASQTGRQKTRDKKGVGEADTQTDRPR